MLYSLGPSLTTLPRYVELGMDYVLQYSKELCMTNHICDAVEYWSVQTAPEKVVATAIAW